MSQPPPGETHCYKHPGTPARVLCQRCGRPVCPLCQVPAAVGVQCRDCVHADQRRTPAPRSWFGAPLGPTKPVVTMTIIAICVVVYIAQMFAFQPVTAQLALAPGFVWTEPWRLVTGAFAHGGVAHLLLNMYALWVVGTFAEQLLGRARFIALYFGSALGGAAMVLAYFRLFDFTYQGAVQATVGASGAVFGLFAALLVLGRRIKADIRGIAIVIAFNLVLSFTLAHISWQGHVGGMLTGAAMAAVYAYAPPKRRRLFAWLAIAGVLVLVAAVVVATVSPMALGA